MWRRRVAAWPGGVASLNLQRVLGPLEPNSSWRQVRVEMLSAMVDARLADSPSFEPEDEGLCDSDVLIADVG